MTPREFAEAVATMLLVRKGEVITEDVAHERANNIAAAFGDWINPPTLGIEIFRECPGCDHPTHAGPCNESVLHHGEARLCDCTKLTADEEIEEAVAVCIRCGEKERAGLVDANGRCEACADVNDFVVLGECVCGHKYMQHEWKGQCGTEGCRCGGFYRA